MSRMTSGLLGAKVSSASSWVSSLIQLVISSKKQLDQQHPGLDHLGHGFDDLFQETLASPVWRV